MLKMKTIEKWRKDAQKDPIQSHDGQAAKNQLPFSQEVKNEANLDSYSMINNELDFGSKMQTRHLDSGS